MKKEKSSIKIFREYSVNASIIFNEIKEGVLFKLTGADKMDFDFREGGSYELIFNNRGEIEGTFIKIIPKQKIVMNWNVTGFGRIHEKNTKVLISIVENVNTKVIIEHTEIKNKNSAIAKQTAWTEILIDLEKKLNILGMT